MRSWAELLGDAGAAPESDEEARGLFGRLRDSLGKSRRHLKNIARDPHVTLCVDEDPRTTDLTKSPRAVVCYGGLADHRK